MSFSRPSGLSRFITRSAAKLGLPSAWLDEEYDAIYTIINGLTLVANSTEWTQYPAAVTYVSGTDFTVVGDQTAEFYAKRRVRPANAGAYVYSKVSSSSYNGGTGLTTVVLADSVLLATLNQVFYSITHSNKTINAIHAEMIPSTAYAGLAATDVQAALEELESEKLQSVDVFGDWVVSGLLGSDPGATLTMTTPSGVCHQTGKRVVSAGFTHTYTASKDTYDDIDSAGTITHVAVNNGAGVPAVTADSQRLQKVVTNGSEITSVTDMRLTVAPIACLASTATTATKTTDGTNIIKTKIIDIGDWNMDSNSFVSIAHGLTHGKIRSVSALIRNNTESVTYDLLNYSTGAGDTAVSGDIQLNAAVGTVILNRKATGGFDGASFNSTSYNRGWITITYVE
jgi:hypothetical protein